MRVIFVRHGESEANVGDFVNDNPARPVALTSRGWAQAREAAETLRRVPFVCAYASEFLRARQTATAILTHHRCALEIDARLNERISGLDGQPTAVFTDLVRSDPVHIRPPGGESFVEQMERLGRFLEAIQGRSHEGGTVLAVSHENPIMAVRALAGTPANEAARGHIPNCGWLEIEWPPT
ncbi:putative phosphoglycerate mutase [Rhodocyclaceae bacterium]|nr:putative phosphoglycerate mutase [Rhodocyclaceae bacterium]